MDLNLVIYKKMNLILNTLQNNATKGGNFEKNRKKIFVFGSIVFELNFEVNSPRKKNCRDHLIMKIMD